MSTYFINRDPKKFWITTGLYPQELLIDLGGTKPINEVKFSVTGARKIVIEGCKTTNASEFKKVGESKGTVVDFILTLINRFD